MMQMSRSSAKPSKRRNNDALSMYLSGLHVNDVADVLGQHPNTIYKRVKAENRKRQIVGRSSILEGWF